MRFIFPIVTILLIAGCVGQTQVVEEIKPSVSLVTEPIFTVETGKTFMMEWNISSAPKTIEHTAVHYGDSHMPITDNTLNIDPKDTVYTKVTDIQSVNIPGDFMTGIKTKSPGRIYGRAHAIVNGVNYWSEEFVVTMKGEAVAPPKPVESLTNEFVITADDDGFSPSSIEVKNNTEVNITFVFKDSNIYFGGLDISGGDFPTIKYKKDSNLNHSIEFTASKGFTLTSYWPATGVVKGSLDVIIS